ncbi:hypothetical protein H2201_007391 [Coniosporium apollinis]|uniref:Spindle pole body component n=1 Tax=Coniosporium apollinis TaxID=61459 RepID=A0ABQ9NJ27_9PEZI|nr:hypothetical protein H2201_007391 [Coniosporium apollinis]
MESYAKLPSNFYKELKKNIEGRTRGEAEDDPHYSAIFTSFPYLDIHSQQRKAPQPSNKFYPSRSLLQAYYSYESTFERDNEQALRKHSDNPSTNIIHVPQLWALKLGEVDRPASIKPFNVLNPKIATTDDVQEVEQIVREQYNPTSFANKDHQAMVSDLDHLEESDFQEFLNQVGNGSKRIFDIEIREQRASMDADTDSNPSGEEEHHRSLFDTGKVNSGGPAIVDAPASQLSEPVQQQTPIQPQVPPFLMWAETELKSSSPEPNSTLDPTVGLKLEEGILSHNVGRVQKRLETEPLKFGRHGDVHEIERGFVDTKFYNAMRQKDYQDLQAVMPVTTANLRDLLDQEIALVSQATGSTWYRALEHATRAIVVFHKIEVHSLFLQYTESLRHLIELFVPEKHSDSITRKCWGSIYSLALILNKADVRPHSRSSDDPIKSTWTIRNFDPGSKLFKKLQLQKPPVGFHKCKRCQDHAGFDAPEQALQHLEEKHFRSQTSARAKLGSFAAGVSPSDLVFRIIDTADVPVVTKYMFLGELLESCVETMSFLIRNARRIVYGVATRDGTKSPRYGLPGSLLDCFRHVVTFVLAAQRAAAYIDSKSQEWDNSQWWPHIEDLCKAQGVLFDFAERAATAMIESRKDLCQMVQTGRKEESLGNIALGPEFVLAWVMRRLVVKPILDGSKATDLYGNFFTKLQFQANHRPRKRLLRDINLLQEELAALNTVNGWQLKALQDYSTVLDDKTYHYSSQRRQQIHIYLKNLASSTARHLVSENDQYNDLFSACKPLSEKTKQSVEINEEDHGKYKGNSEVEYVYDRDDKNYIIILRELDRRDTDLLFEHTRRLRQNVRTKDPRPSDRVQAEALSNMEYIWLRRRDTAQVNSGDIEYGKESAGRNTGQQSSHPSEPREGAINMEEKEPKRRSTLKKVSIVDEGGRGCQPGQSSSSKRKVGFARTSTF